jgi:predicted MPP superfamily phosphohydrolase
MFQIVTDMDFVFNLFMAVLCLVALGVLAKNRSWPRGAAVLCATALAAGGLAIYFSSGVSFVLARYLAWGLFLHGSIMLIGVAILLFGKSFRAAVASLTAGLLVIGIGIDAFWIEPEWLEVSTVEIESAKITKPVRIAIIADFQTDEIGDYERRAIDEVFGRKPDLVLFAGDYLQTKLADLVELSRQLGELFDTVAYRPPLGVYAVQGNTDHGLWHVPFQKLDAVVFPRTRSIEAGELTITGVGMRDSFNPRLAVPAAEGFHIVLGHSPNFALGEIDADLLVAGHTHGGQVQLPLIGPLVTNSKVTRKWASGVTDIGDGRTLIVSRGVGRERKAAPQIRFLCRPQIVIVELKPK